MFDHSWKEILLAGVTRIPMPLPASFWNELYTIFQEFIEELDCYPEVADVYDKTAREWQATSGESLFFSGYFSPYYRNNAVRQGKDNKQVVQFCEPYYRYLCVEAPALLKPPKFRLLADRMMAALFSAVAVYTPFVHSLAKVNGGLAQALLPVGTLPPVAIRLIRYSGDSLFYTNPHVDKSALTVIMHTDEPEESPCLAFAPPEVGPQPLLSRFAPFPTKRGEALAFCGAAPQEAGYTEFKAARHAVRPLKDVQERNVAIFFWLLPGVDMRRFSTVVPFRDDLGLARPKARD